VKDVIGCALHAFPDDSVRVGTDLGDRFARFLQGLEAGTPQRDHYLRMLRGEPTQDSSQDLTPPVAMDDTPDEGESRSPEFANAEC
jgi:hypothetical protein